MANTHSIDFELSSSNAAYITDAAQTGLDITGDITEEAWIKFEQLPSTAGSFFAIATKIWLSNQRSYSFGVNTSDKMVFSYSSTGLSGSDIIDFVCDTAFASTGVWYHTAVVIDVSATACTFYIDGVAQTDTPTSGNTPTSIYNGTARFQVGSSYWTGTSTWFFDGLIDEVRVWDDIRTASEIANNRNKELVGTETNLQGYWKFNNDALDSTSNGNDLTLENSPVYSTDIPTWGIEPNVSDTVGSSESVSLTVSDPNVSASDTVGTSENTSLTVSDPQVNVFDSVGVAESVSITVLAQGVYSLSVSDTVNVTENLVIDPPEVNVTANDSVSVVDTFTEEPLTLAGLIASDAISLAENLSLLVFFETVPGEIGVVDNVKVQESVSISGAGHSSSLWTADSAGTDNWTLVNDYNNDE